MENPVPSAHRDEKFAGASPAVVLLGNSEKYGWMARAIGVAAGLAGAESIALKWPKVIDKGTALLRFLHLPQHGTAVVRLSGAIAGFIVGHWVGMGIGLVKASPHTHEGREQFERIKAERNAALDEVDTLKTVVTAQAHEKQPEPAHSHGQFADRHPSREAQGSHAAAHAAEASSDAHQAMAR